MSVVVVFVKEKGVASSEKSYIILFRSEQSGLAGVLKGEVELT